MLALRNPADAYRRVDFDARVAGSDAKSLVLICYETLDIALASAIHAAARGDNPGKSAAITRAMSAITALQLGSASFWRPDGAPCWTTPSPLTAIALPPCARTLPTSPAP